MPEAKIQERLERFAESYIVLAQKDVDKLTDGIGCGDSISTAESQVLSHMTCDIERFARMRSYEEGQKPYPLPA